MATWSMWKRVFSCIGRQRLQQGGQSCRYSTTLQHVQAAPLQLEETAGSTGETRTTTSAVDPSPQDNPLAFPDFFNVKEMTNLRELLKSRVHLGHKTGMWNPLMKRYIHGCRDGIHIIDLDMTLEHLRLALNVAAHIAYRNGIILFVNERSQFERLVQQTARDCGEYVVSQRWRGGTLTNSFMLLGTLRLPDLAIFLSVPPSKTAIKEVAMCNIPSIGIVDTDCNPNLITYPVPGNDDTPSAMKLYCRLFCDIIKRAKAKRKEADKAASDKKANPLFDLLQSNK